MIMQSHNKFYSLTDVEVAALAVIALALASRYAWQLGSRCGLR
jgi:hypothetical protein